ncbi:MAG: O-antigen ligase family protein [Acidobacteria bacterium]|nr:O-antigen ligase family protein [Acidobacteriota bacterium]
MIQAPLDGPVVDRRPASPWTDLAVRVAVLPLLAVYLGGPGQVLLASPQIPTWVRALLMALVMVAIARPHWSPAVLIGIVPLLPVWPTVEPSLPRELVHLVVATQAIPWLVYRIAGRRGDGSSLSNGWALLTVVATVSLLVTLTPEPWRGLDLPHVWRQVQAQMPAYIFGVDRALVPSALPEWTVIVDGLSCTLITGWATTRATRERILRAAGVAAIATAVFGMVQAATGIGLQHAWRVFDAGIVRINATYVDPNALAAFYTLVAPVIAGLALRSSGWRRGAWAAAGGIVFVATVMTAGRAGLLALAAGALVMVWLGLRRDLDAIDPSVFVRRHARRALRVSVATVVASIVTCTAVGTALDIRHEQQTSYLHTWLYTFNLRQPPDAIAKGRIAVWHVALTMIRERPLVGQGVGQAPLQFERVRAQLGIESLPPNAYLSPHNTYLLVTAELGLLGLGAFLLLLVAVVIGMRAPGNLPMGASTAWPVVGLFGGLAGYALTMLTGDRILLREDVVVGTICTALATLGAGRPPRAWRLAAAALVGVTLASWPIRAGWVGSSADSVDRPPDEGVYFAEQGSRGDMYRWTTGDTVLYVPAGSYRVEIPLRNLSPGVQRLDVSIDERPADQRDLESGPWTTLEYRLPARPDGRWHTIRLRVTPTWQVPGDGRILGAILGEWRYEAR